MKTYVFLGPSLPVREARAILDAVYLPPVRAGDVAALMAGPNHGSRALGSSAANALSRSARAVSNQASSSAPLRSRNRAAIVSGSIPPSASAADSSALNCSGWTAERTLAGCPSLTAEAVTKE